MIFYSRALLPPTKTGKRKHGYIKLRPFEEQKECKICPRNLCKGKALTKYLMTQGPFTHVSCLLLIHVIRSVRTGLMNPKGRPFSRRPSVLY